MQQQYGYQQQSESSSSSEETTQGYGSQQSESNSNESNENSQETARVQYKQLALKHPQKPSQECFSVNKLAVCPQGYKPKGTITKKINVYCLNKQAPQAAQIKEQIQAGQHRDFSTKQNEEIQYQLPQQCVRRN